MNERERPSTPQSMWKSIDEKEEGTMDITFTPDQLCAMARSRESESVWSRRILLFLLIALAAGLAYNVLTVSQPWVRLSQGWMFMWTCLLVWRFRRGPGRMNATESCASFLRREFESKRRGFLEIRGYMFLLTPPILALWWGGGPAIRLKALGVPQSSGVYQFASGSWPFIVIVLLLVLVWLAFGLAAKKATRELGELDRRTQE